MTEKICKNCAFSEFMGMSQAGDVSTCITSLNCTIHDKEVYSKHSCKLWAMKPDFDDELDFNE